MEVVIIDAATFNRMLAGFGELAEKVERLCREHADMGDMQWLDSGAYVAARHQPPDIADNA